MFFLSGQETQLALKVSSNRKFRKVVLTECASASRHKVFSMSFSLLSKLFHSLYQNNSLIIGPERTTLQKSGLDAPLHLPCARRNYMAPE